MSSSSKSRKSDPSPNSLTPQRKHRKLLKDGSGSEVWPESIEKVFVQGLNEYWDSPWATYSQSRGRSRWRNQFLVDYLQKAGITRSKKQVASHIQVLRNMWKGEPQFYLVSGGEEPSAETTPVKLEDRSLIPLDFDETDDASSSSASPDFSPPELQSEFPPSPVHFGGGYTIPSQEEIKDSSPYTQDMIYTTSMPSSLSAYPVDMGSQPYHENLPVRNAHYSLGGFSSHHNGQIHTNHRAEPRLAAPDRVPNHNTYSFHPQSPIRPMAICLSANGMTPLTVRLDALIPTACTALALYLRLSITPEHGIRSPSALDGFFGTISLSRLWANSGKCVTRVYTNNMCVSEEVGTLEVSNIELGIVNAALPESSLNKCRWIEPSFSTKITQEIIVDNETLVYVIYELDRSNGNVMPSAKLEGYQQLKVASKLSPQTSPASSHPPTTTGYSSFLNAQSTSASRHTTQPSLSYALTPINNTRHVMPISMSF